MANACVMGHYHRYAVCVMMIFPDAAATVGNTPLVELERLGRGLPGRIVAKLEMRNPCGSVKDRVGVALIEDAERQSNDRHNDPD